MRESKDYNGTKTVFYYNNGNIIGEESESKYTKNVFDPTGIITRQLPRKYYRRRI